MKPARQPPHIRPSMHTTPQVSAISSPLVVIVANTMSSFFCPDCFGATMTGFYQTDRVRLNKSTENAVPLA